MGGQIEIGRELVGVPTDVGGAHVRVDAAERAGFVGDGELVLHRVAGEGGVVGLDVELEVLQQVVFAEEVEAGGGVRIVLVGGRLLWLGLNVELAGEADFLFIIHGHVEEAGEVVELALHVGVEQGGVALAATPEGVALAAEAVGDFHGFFHLGGGVGVNLGVRAGGGALLIARVDEKAGGAPEQFLASAFLLFFEHVGDGVERLVGGGEIAHFRSDVAVMEAVVVEADFFHEVEEHAGAVLGVSHGIAAVIPRVGGGACAERIGPGAAHRVPIGAAEAEPLGHGLAFDDLGGVVMFERERVFRAGAFVGDGVAGKLSHVSR